jgi:hypothetical protein
LNNKIYGKQADIFREVLPKLTRIGDLLPTLRKALAGGDLCIQGVSGLRRLALYGVSFPDLYRCAATSANLSVEPPRRFELVIDVNTDKQIGLTIPPKVLARADKVIQ